MDIIHIVIIRTNFMNNVRKAFSTSATSVVTSISMITWSKLEQAVNKIKNMDFDI